jgi:hypothetical protein
MPSIFDPARQSELNERLAKLTPETPARWGKFNATRMLSHVNDALRMAIADLQVKPKGPSFLSSSLGRYLVIHLLPWPKGAPTAPELLARGDTAQFEVEKKHFGELVAKIGSRKDVMDWPEHPAFGPMTRKDWGALGYKHVHHHFTQFGI